MWRVYHPAVVLLKDLLTWEQPWWPQLGAWLTLRNSHESVIVSMIFNTLPACLIDGVVLCVFYQYLVKEASSRRSPLCLSDGDEFTKEGSRRSLPVPNPQYDVARFCSCFMIWWFVLLLLICFIFPETQLLGGLLDVFWMWRENLSFPLIWLWF